MVNYWGAPTWLFIHSFIECMKEEFYKKNINNVINIIKQICVLLPCPYCADHAKKYIKTLNSKRVPTKEHMKQYLFNFHNDVNKRLNKPIFTNYDKYKKARLNIIIQMFCDKFITPALSKRFTENMRRKHLKNNIIKFINNNSSHFIWWK